MKHQLLVSFQCPRAGMGNQGGRGNRFVLVVRNAAGNLPTHKKTGCRSIPFVENQLFLVAVRSSLTRKRHRRHGQVFLTVAADEMTRLTASKAFHVR